MVSDSAATSAAQLLHLRDGRRLAYNEWGDPAGKPVLYFHGLHSSRLALYRDPAFFAAYAIRFITVDRPGVGMSDFQPDRKILDWLGDVAQLADALALDRFAILALTGGGPYALACAAKLPERLTGVALVSSPAPLDAPGMTVGGATGRLLALARRAPWVLRALYATLVPYYRRHPDRVSQLIAGGFSSADNRVAERPEVRAMQAAMFLEVFHSGYRGAVCELVAESGGWGFRLQDIGIPVQIWDGDQNNLVPPSHAEYLAHTIPHAQLHLCHGEGHLLIVEHMEEIIQGIVDRTSAG